MPAPKDNNFNLKWKTQQERQEVFAAVCRHLEDGYSKQSFPLADWDTVERYCEAFPEDFPTEKLEQSMRLHRLEWEKMGLDGVKGKTQGFNATAWIFNMKNRFRDEWNDTIKQEVTGKDGGPIETEDKGAGKLLAYLDAVSSRAPSTTAE